ncbi:MAG: hypothetical protein VB046_01810 [Paludibacter sp.]|nr:hypothetical protein [Paludibacter sp.]
MRKLIYFLTFITLAACTSKTSKQVSTDKNEFTNEIISDSTLSQISTTDKTKFELKNNKNQTKKKNYIQLNQGQLNFFFSRKEQKELFDYFSNPEISFKGKKKLGNNWLAIFISLDADYLGEYLYCAVIDRNGKFLGKFLLAYIDLDAGYSNLCKGEFVNDSTIKILESGSEYIDSEHLKYKTDSTTKIIGISKTGIRIMNEIKQQPDTIEEKITNR